MEFVFDGRYPKYVPNSLAARTAVFTLNGVPNRAKAQTNFRFLRVHKAIGGAEPKLGGSDAEEGTWKISVAPRAVGLGRGDSLGRRDVHFILVRVRLLQPDSQPTFERRRDIHSRVIESCLCRAD